LTALKLGKRQKEVLDMMQRNGGSWPTQWRIPYAKQDVFDSLETRGLIVLVGARYRMVVP